MKILFVFSYPVRIGGGFKSALAMAKYLSRKGCQIVIAAPGGTTEMIGAFEKTGAEFVSIDSLAKRLPIPTLSGAKELGQVIREKNIDLIHAQEYPSIGRAYLAAIRTGCAFLATEPGGFFPYHVPVKDVHTVLFSMEQKDVFTKKYSLLDDNLHLIRARIDTDVYRPLPQNSEFVQRHSLPTTGLKICMAIRLEPQKKRWVQAIFSAAEQLKQSDGKVHFIIAGEGTLLNEFKSQASQINQTCPADVSVDFMGPILGEEEICDFYNYADVVVGNGRGILEAMACRKAVMILGEQGQGQWIEPETVEQASYNNFSGRHFRYHSDVFEDLVQSLKIVIENLEKKNQYAEFAYNYIHEYMDAAIGAEELITLYQHTLSKKVTLKQFATWYIKAVFHKIMASPQLLKAKLSQV
jgi:glycosyltransferase involved in cell wall biosynthesis